MNRVPLLVSLVAGIVLAVSSAASAQELRDPFDPLITQDSGSTGTTGGQAPVVVQPQPAAPTEDLPVTGARGIADWMVLAGAFIVMGLGLLAIAKINRPARSPARG